MATTGTCPLQSLAPEEQRGGEAGDEGHTEGERRGMRGCGGALREIESCADGKATSFTPLDDRRSVTADRSKNVL